MRSSNIFNLQIDFLTVLTNLEYSKVLRISQQEYALCCVVVVVVVFSERRYMLSPVRLSSVVCLSVSLSVTFVRPTQAAQIFGNILRH